ncbi:LLM class flavin-dependent oxidoreductase [Metabacillus halosaccharovorans]|uniref:NtaA/DmoA family FMN-dependent monooxygenase n=1 Tax=Metabacillus halosaccharovorans TaxID=930124 RepID=UPI00403D6FEB
MTKENRQMHLNLFIQAVGHHEAAWRYSKTNPKDVMEIEYYQGLAQKAEEAKFDSIFLADTLALNNNIKFGPNVNFFEPFTLLSAIAAVTKRIGFIGTVTTTYNEPYHVARKFASLDHISKGRVGWNIVTSANGAEAYNFSRDSHLEHSERYSRAREFLKVTTDLWDSWQDDALTFDRENGVFADDRKIREINHVGETFKVRGPLNIARPVQGYPVLVQAGSSEDGREFAAQHAEAIFTLQDRLEVAQEFYSDVKGRLVKYGRKAEHLVILPGLCPIIGKTEAEAKEKEVELNELTSPEYGLQQLTQFLGIDLSSYPLDGPVPPLPSLEEFNGQKSKFKIILDLVEREDITIHQLLHRMAPSRGHVIVTGTPEQIADRMEEWFMNKGCDGFNVLPPYLPGGLEEFNQYVVPELQRRGLFRTEYTGSTLRDHLGLPRPVNEFTMLSSK